MTPEERALAVCNAHFMGSARGWIGDAVAAAIRAAEEEEREACALLLDAAALHAECEANVALVGGSRADAARWRNRASESRKMATAIRARGAGA